MSIAARTGWPALGRAATLAIIYLGLPLLGWGVQDIPGFFAHPTRLAYTALVAAHALLGAWLVYRFPSPKAKAPNVKRAEPPVLLARWHAYLFETIAVLAAYGDPRNVLVMDESATVRWLGLGLFATGAALMNWAMYIQALHLSALPVAAPELLDAGPYRHLRHPNYLAALFYCLGFALLFRSWLGVGLMLAQVAAVIHRIENEEELLARRHGAVWAERARTSWKLIPYLY